MFVSSFDSDDDDDGDGHQDFLAVPEWVAYELRGLSEVSGTLAEPDISIHRPTDWYKSLELEFLWLEQPHVSKSRVDNSYDGIGRIWNRGHLAMADHAQRFGHTGGFDTSSKNRTEIGWQSSCNTHVFWNAVLAPIDRPPCRRHRFLPGRGAFMHTPSFVLAPQILASLVMPYLPSGLKQLAFLPWCHA